MIYLFQNFAMPTTASPTAVATGTTVKTLLQVKPLVVARIIDWGISFDGSAAATPGTVELIETDVAATVTAFVDADITKYGPSVADAAAPSVYFTEGISASGYTASAEGSITSVRSLAPTQKIAPTTQFIEQLPLGRESIIQIGKFARIRVTFPASVNCFCYMLLEV